MLTLDDHDLQLIKKTIRYSKTTEKKIRNKHSKYFKDYGYYHWFI